MSYCYQRMLKFAERIVFISMPYCNLRLTGWASVCLLVPGLVNSLSKPYVSVIQQEIHYMLQIQMRSNTVQADSAYASSVPKMVLSRRDSG
jgi:hypothetical protein